MGGFGGGGVAAAEAEAWADAVAWGAAAEGPGPGRRRHGSRLDGEPPKPLKTWAVLQLSTTRVDPRCAGASAPIAGR